MFHDTGGVLGKIQEDAKNEDSRMPGERDLHKQGIVNFLWFFTYSSLGFPIQGRCDIFSVFCH